jgi:hypothetical protein
MNMNKSMILGMALGAAMIPAQIIYAQNTTASLTVVQTFGCGGHSEGWCKSMMQDNSGKSYLVWYDNQLDISVGDGVVLSYEANTDGSVYSWNQLSNPVNGVQANVTKYLPVQP